MKWIEKMKERWGLESNKQFWIIMLVFALTGTTAVEIKKLIYYLLGIQDSAWWVKALLWLPVITPFYYLFLVIYAKIFGQWPFFKGVMKKTASRFKRKPKAITETPADTK